MIDGCWWACSASVLIGGIARRVSRTRADRRDAGFSINGCLPCAKVLLASVCAEGARMRDDLEGTVYVIAVKLDDLLHDRRMTLTDSPSIADAREPFDLKR